MPVLPPTDESTCESNVVGICIKLIPLMKVAAAKPVRSPITPPPKAMSGISIRFIFKQFRINRYSMNPYFYFSLHQAR